MGSDRQDLKNRVHQINFWRNRSYGFDLCVNINIIIKNLKERHVSEESCREKAIGFKRNGSSVYTCALNPVPMTEIRRK